MNDTMKLADFENHQFHTKVSVVRVSYTGRVITNFVFKYSNFCYYGNRSPLDASCNDIIKLADPENPFGTKIWELSPMKIELQPVRRLGSLNVVFGESGSPLLLTYSPLSNLVKKTKDHQRLTAYVLHQ